MPWMEMWPRDLLWLRRGEGGHMWLRSNEWFPLFFSPCCYEYGKMCQHGNSLPLGPWGLVIEHVLTCMWLSGVRENKALLYSVTDIWGLLVTVGKPSLFWMSQYFFFFNFYFLAVLGLRFVRGLSLAAASGGHSSSRCGDRSSSQCAGLSLSRPLPLRGTGSRRAGSAVVAHGPSCSVACGILPDQGLNPCPLH